MIIAITIAVNIIIVNNIVTIIAMVINTNSSVINYVNHTVTAMYY